MTINHGYNCRKIHQGEIHLIVRPSATDIPMEEIAALYH